MYHHSYVFFINDQQKVNVLLYDNHKIRDIVVFDYGAMSWILLRELIIFMKEGCDLNLPGKASPKKRISKLH